MSAQEEIDLLAEGSTDPTTASSGAAAGADDEEAEIAAMKARVAEMEAEAAKLRELQAQAELEMNGGAGASGSGSAGANGADEDARMAGTGPSQEEKEEVDSRSIYVKNVDWGATPEELQQHFQSCGTINRVTILCDKFTGHPKGYAYVEFADPSLVANAMALHESLFRGRLIKVEAKRTNIPGMSARGRGRGRGRGFGRGRPYFRGRGRGRGYY